MNNYNNGTNQNNGYNYQNGNYYNNTNNYPNDNIYNDNYGYQTYQMNLRETLTQEVVTKSFMFMLIALLISAFAAFTTSPYMVINLMSSGMFYVLVIAELAIVFISNWAISKNKPVLAGVLFAIYSYINGTTLSVIFLAYSGKTIISAFAVTAVTFGIMAVYGFVTKKDLTKIGNLLLMALIGVLISSFVNIIIFKSSTFDLIVDAVVILIFIGITAYDTQKIKKMIAISNDNNVLCLSLFGAFQLYLDFINIFLRVLRLMSRRK